MYKHDTESRPHNHCCHVKAISITYSAFVSVALVIQYATRMRHIKFSPLAYLAASYFPRYLVNGTIFGNKIVNIKCVF
jgi:hypothetical protein